MSFAIWTITILLMLTGLLGLLLPGLPGSPLIFGGVLVMAWYDHFDKISILTLVILGFLTVAVGIIDVFNYYISVAKDLDFRGRFLEMAGLSLGVAALSFGVGFVLRAFFGIEV